MAEGAETYSSGYGWVGIEGWAGREVGRGALSSWATALLVPFCLGGDGGRSLEGQGWLVEALRKRF